MLVAIILVLAVLQGSQDMRPTIVATRSEPPRRNFNVIYYDDRFLFAERHYGSAADPGGNTEPGLFVHSKEHNHWIRISAISTADGSFGKSVTDDPVAMKKLRLASVSWDFTMFAQRPYIEQPLRTSGSISFPDRIEYDARTDRYQLRYQSSWEVPTAETVLYIRRADLTQVFAAK